MAENVLTAEQILEAAEEVLRRYGPGKTTVVDVARSLGVSHGSIYRHFADKAALRDAVAERWLERISLPLESIVDAPGPALSRLRRWFDLLIASKHQRMLDDPELFTTYVSLAADAREVIRAHVATLVSQLTRILEDGLSKGEFHLSEEQKRDVRSVAQALFDATARFHNPIHATEWANPAIGPAFEAVWSLFVAGLGVRNT